ncbi:MAG TPA: putative porin [Pontiella sp.]
MNRKFAYTIAAVIALSAAAAMAGGETEEKTIEERLAALEAGAKKSSWSENLTVKGDLRYRYEYKATDDDTTTDRHRIRARIGAYGKVADNVKVGLRLASGSTDDDEAAGSEATSSNQTLEDNFSEKPVWIDLAYITLGCPKIEDLNTTFGKMKQPWVSVSDLIFDTDVNPEGIASVYEFGSDDLALTAVAAYHMLDDKGTGEDDNLTSGQLAVETDVGEHVKLTAGVGAYYYSELPYEIIDGFVKADIKTEALPIKLYGEYLNNTASGVEEDTAWLVGIGTKCPVTGVKLDYNYRDLEADSVYGGLDDGDFGGPDGKGHKIKLSYGLARNTTVGATYFRVDRNNTDRDVLQLDLVVKF